LAASVPNLCSARAVGVAGGRVGLALFFAVFERVGCGS
jgi:hypothetical protein